MAESDNDKLSESKNSVEEIELDPRLDFFSDQFDPILALKAPNLIVPDPKAKKFDNLAIYMSSIDKKETTQTSKKKQVDEELKNNAVRRWLPHQMPVPTKSRLKVKNIFTKMEGMKGPLALLRKCIEDRLRIKILTRNDTGVRGYCLAYLVVFDKHWNLALEEVTEFWTRRKKGNCLQ